jgi:hypothetical protein
MVGKSAVELKVIDLAMRELRIQTAKQSKNNLILSVIWFWYLEIIANELSRI